MPDFSLALPWLPAVVLVLGAMVAVAALAGRRRWGVRVTLDGLRGVRGTAGAEVGAVSGSRAGIRASRWRRALGSSPPGLRAGSLIALTLFVAGPRRTVELPGEPTRGVAMMIALDVSGSMAEEGTDGTPRLRDAVTETRRFLEGREGDRVGLVTFGAEALVRVPPTGDRRPLLDALASVRAGEDGDATAIGTALGLAAARLRTMEARSKVIVLVTDGQSNAGVLDPLTAARAAATLGQHIYVVDVGDTAPDDGLLDEIARVGGGHRWVASDRSGAQTAYGEISSLEPSSFPGAPRTDTVPAGHWLLWVAATLLLVERGLLATRLGRLA